MLPSCLSMLVRLTSIAGYGDVTLRCVRTLTLALLTEHKVTRTQGEDILSVK